MSLFWAAPGGYAMSVLGVIRLPFDIARSLAGGAIDVSLAALRAARGLVEDDSLQTGWDVAGRPPPPPPATRSRMAPTPAPGPGPAPTPAPAPATRPAPAPAPPPAEEHVSEEPVPVAEFAEPGAEDGASAELRVEEPWEGYARQDARTIARELAGATSETLAAVELFERTHKQRRSVTQAAERRLRRLSRPAAARNR